MRKDEGCENRKNSGAGLVKKRSGIDPDYWERSLTLNPLVTVRLARLMPRWVTVAQRRVRDDALYFTCHLVLEVFASGSSCYLEQSSL